jgi:hypothetical protein
MKYGTSIKNPVRHSILLAMLLAFASCTDTDDTLPAPPPPGTTVRVSLNLSASEPVFTPLSATEEAGEAFTRAVDDSDTPPYTTVKNVWILQFNGQADAAVLSGLPIYIADYDTKSDNERVCALLTGTGQTVWFLANTFNAGMMWEEGLTLGTLKTRYMPVTTEADLYGHGAGGTDYLLMNGAYTGDITSDTDLQATLRRNAVRLDFRLKNTSTGATTVTIDSVKPVIIMSRQFFYTNYVLPDIFPVAGSEYTGASYAKVLFSDGTTDGDYVRFRFYLPANQRGTVAAITNQWEKNRYAPAAATAVRVYGQYTEGANTVPVTYTIYPGANLTTDFNLRPDHAYTLSVEINGPGDPSADPRVQHMSLRDFAAPGEERANCYILNPSPAGTRQFRIPVDRINVFWGGHGYENVPANTLYTDTEWEASALWTDFTAQDTNPAAANYFKFVEGKDKGTGFEGNRDGYFTVEVGKLTAGNALIAVKKKGEADILWSWHLWITDYDPYQGKLGASVNAVQVPGGLVTNFGTSVTVAGKRAIVMDRLLGHNTLTRLPLYYQAGRKDPFIRNASSKLVYSELVADVTTIAGAVSHPNTLYQTKNYNPRFNRQWLAMQVDDPNPWAERNMPQSVKSLFDPCPAGFSVPPAYNNAYNYRDMAGRNTNPEIFLTDAGDTMPFAHGFFTDLTGTATGTSISRSFVWSQDFTMGTSPANGWQLPSYGYKQTYSYSVDNDLKWDGNWYWPSSWEMRADLGMGAACPILPMQCSPF